MNGLTFLAGTAPPYLIELTLLVVASALFSYICHRLGTQPIVGFLLTGILIGPGVLGLVDDQQVIDAAAEVGVILLLFTIGIEFSLENLARVKKYIFLGGGLQVVLTAGLVIGALTLLEVDFRAALFTGCLVALSSTAIVMKLLSDRGEAETQGGRFALSILIFQDLAVVVMVMLVPILAGMGGSAGGIAWAVGQAVVVIGAVLLVARRLMPKLLELVAKTCSQEIFLLTLIAICFGTACLTSLAGVSLSLGAFLAGLLVSESRFSHHAFGEILPLQILFSAVFFVSVGLLLDVAFLFQNIALVLGVVLCVLVLKTVISGLSALALGFPLQTALFSGLLLAQVGEFSFVLERAGREMSLYPAGMANQGAQTFIAATVLLMVLTPLMAHSGAALERLVGRKRLRKAADGMAQGMAASTSAMLKDHVLISGYGNAGEKLAQALDDFAVPYLILTLSPEGANQAESRGRPVLRGDYTRVHTLKSAGIEHARMLVVPDDAPSVAASAVSVARSLRPDLRILVRTQADLQAQLLDEAGADTVISGETESVVQLLDHILPGYGVELSASGPYLRKIRNSLLTQPALRSRPVRLDVSGRSSAQCSHLDQARQVVAQAEGCQECLKEGGQWVHLRLCLTCGHVGCCDSSSHKHARGHFESTGHALMCAWEPGENWAWCFIDEVEVGMIQ